jgi:hypothetical protein
MALNTQTGNNWYSKGGMQRKFAEGGLVPRRNPKGDVILEDAWLITRNEYNKENLITHLPKGAKPEKATLKLQDYFAQITNLSHTSKVNEAIKKGLYIEAVNSGKMTRQRANEIISSIGNTKDLIPMNETKKYVESGKITQFEIEAMRNYINGKNPNPKLKDSFEKVLRKFGVDLERSDLKDFPQGKYVNPYDFSGYEYMRQINEEAGVFFLLTGEYKLVSKAIYDKDYSMWLFYNYLGRINISFKACQEWLNQAKDYFEHTMPIPIFLVHTPRAKDGRSFAGWMGVSEELKAQAESRIGRPLTFEYNRVYYYNEIGMVGNYDYKGTKAGDGWGTYYKEKKTGLLIPEYTETSFHFNTLIHEFAHCLDFQSQLVNNIGKFKDKKEKGEVYINTEKMTDAELALYSKQLKQEEQKGENVAQPITNHFEEFVDSLIRVLRACSSGNIPLTQLYEQQALDVQQALAGKYGDLLLEQREKRAKDAKELAKEDEMRENKRFTWQSSWINDIKQYAYQHSLIADLKEKLKSNSKYSLTLIEALELDNLITGYFNEEFKKYTLQNPSKASQRLDDIKSLKMETNRIINNHYDNVKSNYQYGFKPESELELYIRQNCDIRNFRDYKSWKECAKEKIQAFQ